MCNTTITKQKYSLTCVFVLQCDAERPYPGRVSPLLLLPPQHKQERTVLARAAGDLHCRRTGKSPSNERKKLHSFRYCSHAMIWFWHKNKFLEMFKTCNIRGVPGYNLSMLLFHLAVQLLLAKTLFRIREFPALTFVPKAGYPDSEVLWFSSAPPHTFRDNMWNCARSAYWSLHCSLTILSLSIKLPFDVLISLITDSVCK